MQIGISDLLMKKLANSSLEAGTDFLGFVADIKFRDCFIGVWLENTS